MPQDPKSETVLSSHELALGYREVKDPSIYVKFKVRGAEESFLVWTTTPWTLISNVALCVGTEIDYVRVAHVESGEVLILAKSRLQVLLDKNEEGASLWQVRGELKGGELEGLEYEPLFTYIRPEKKVLVCHGWLFCLHRGWHRYCPYCSGLWC